MKNLLFFEAHLSDRIQKTQKFYMMFIIKEFDIIVGMQEENIYQFPKIEYDAQGFTKSFDLENFDPLEVTDFYHKYGFVIFNNVISIEEAEKTIDELWLEMKTLSGIEEIDRHDKNTWNLKKWKGNYGFVTFKPLNTLQVCLNRQNPNVYKAFKRMYELSSGKPLQQPLIAQFDRGSAMRPAKINPDWITKSIYHFDINPWWWTNVVPSSHKDWRNIKDYVPEKFAQWKSQGNNLPFIGYTKLAGVLALTDTSENSGGFECVPGFQNCILDWCKQTPYQTPVEKDQILMKNMQKVYQRKNSLLVFTRELPHNIYHNLSEEFRFAQYLRMSPLSTLMLTEYEIEKRKKCVEYFLPKELPVDDPISKEIYMIN